MPFIYFAFTVTYYDLEETLEEKGHCWFSLDLLLRQKCKCSDLTGVFTWQPWMGQMRMRIFRTLPAALTSWAVTGGAAAATATVAAAVAPPTNQSAVSCPMSLQPTSALSQPHPNPQNRLTKKTNTGEGRKEPKRRGKLSLRPMSAFQWKLISMPGAVEAHLQRQVSSQTQFVSLLFSFLKSMVSLVYAKRHLTIASRNRRPSQ